MVDLEYVCISSPSACEIVARLMVVGLADEVYVYGFSEPAECVTFSLCSDTDFLRNPDLIALTNADVVDIVVDPVSLECASLEGTAS